MRLYRTAGVGLAVAIVCTACLLAGLAVATDTAVGDDHEPEIEVEDVSVDESTVEVGDTVTVSATLENDDDRGGIFLARLQVDGDTVDRRPVGVGPEETETIEFRHRFFEPGEYEISVNGEGDETVTVEEPGEPDVGVANAGLGSEMVQTGDRVIVWADLENDGDAPGEHETRLAVDGTVVETETVEVEAGGSERVEFRRSFDAADTYHVEVNGVVAGDLVVEDDEDDDGDGGDGGDDGDDGDDGEGGDGGDDGDGGDGGDDGDDGDDDAADVAVVEAAVGTERVTAGESVQVEATFENRGDRTVDHVAVLEVGDVVRAERSIQIQGGKTVIARFAPSVDATGSHPVHVDGVRAGSVTVTGSADKPAGSDSSPGRPSYELSEPTVTPADPDPGDVIEITATVENVGDAAGRFPVTFTVDGDVYMVEPVRLGPGDSERVSFSRSFREVGRYDLGIEDAGTVTVAVGEPGSLEDGNGWWELSDTLAIVDVRTPADWARTGHDTSARVTVANAGDDPERHTFTIAVDGRPVANETAEIPPNSRTVLDLEFAATAGRVTVDGAPAGRLQVGDPPGGDSGGDGGPPVHGRNPILFVGAVSLVLGTGAMIAIRSRSLWR